MRNSGEETKIPPPPVPTYKQMPIEAPAQSGNGTGNGSPFYDKNPTELPRLPLRSIVEPARHGSDDLVEAANNVCKALLRQIAYHETEAQKLRAALVPFALASRQNGAPAPKAQEQQDVLMQKILTFAGSLPVDEEIPP